jgi:hypothetical protein
MKLHLNKDFNFNNKYCPAVEYANGSKEWYFNGELHREDDPAIVWTDGSKFWYFNGKLHREDGPAIEYTDGTKEYWVNDKQLTEEDFNKQFTLF